jgi:hypothetical protein
MYLTRSKHKELTGVTEEEIQKAKGGGIGI